MPFTRQGEKRPPNAGRRAGTPNKATKELKDFLRDLVKKPEIQEAIEKQILAGDRGAAQLFIAAMNQVLGKPREAVEVSTSPGMAEFLKLCILEAQARGRGEAGSGSDCPPGSPPK
jgi:hypothetical protein